MSTKNNKPLFGANKSKYGYEVIKDNEAVIAAQTIMECSPELSVEEMLLDIKCIDAMLHAKKLNSVAVAMTKRTKAGFLRKDSHLSVTLNAIINGRVLAQNDYNLNKLIK